MSTAQRIDSPLVSVCVITYNQEKYIRQCLLSILDQETDFEFEVIVGDDCSTDDSGRVIGEILAEYPGKVRAIFQEKNTGGTKNYLDVHAAAQGRYVAHLDGDDYALPTKLQKQVDVFRANPNLSMVVHGAKILDEETGEFLPPVTRYYGNRVENLSFLLLNLPYFAHSSKMYRRTEDEDFQFKGKEVIDCEFHIYHASKGDIYLIPEELIVYRKNIGLSTDKKSDKIVVNQRTNEQFHRAIDSALSFNVEPDLVQRSHAQAEFLHAISLLRGNCYSDYRRSIERSRAYRITGPLQYSFYLLKSFPAFARLLWEVLRWTAGKLGSIRAS